MEKILRCMELTGNERPLLDRTLGDMVPFLKAQKGKQGCHKDLCKDQSIFQDKFYKVSFLQLKSTSNQPPSHLL